MKLFKIAEEGDILDDAKFVFIKVARRNKYYGPKFMLIRNKIVCKDRHNPVVKRTRLCFYLKDRPKVTLTNNVYIKGFSYFKDTQSSFEGYLKTDDLKKFDLSIDVRKE